jgi:two-component system sensor histidine kinase KdpD
MAETLEYGVDLPASEHRDIAHAIRLQAEALQRLMTNLLDLARMQSEGVRLNKEWHAIDEIVGSALRHIGPALKDHRVKTALPMDLPLIAVDAVLIERVLANLLDNAGKYTPPGSTIVVGATCLNDAIHLYVEDDGPGLPSLEPERLFEPFARGQKESSIAGVGLGLALSRSVVKAHDGVIRAEQRRPHGARFEIQLPRGSPPEIEREVIE